MKISGSNRKWKIQTYGKLHFVVTSLLSSTVAKDFIFNSDNKEIPTLVYLHLLDNLGRPCNKK